MIIAGTSTISIIITTYCDITTAILMAGMDLLGHCCGGGTASFATQTQDTAVVAKELNSF